MRKVLTPLLLIMSMLLVLVAPAAADKPETRLVEEFDVLVEVPGNPCLGTSVVQLRVFGEYELHALPSIDSFFSGDFTHATWKTTAAAEGDDGYSAPRRHYFTRVINQRDGTGPDEVVTEVRNLMFSGPDGGKYRVHELIHSTTVDGEIRSSVEVIGNRCIQQPGS